MEVLRGIYPFGGATIRLPQQTGWGNAMRWLLTGDEFDADEAHAHRPGPGGRRRRGRRAGQRPARSRTPSPTAPPHWESGPCWRRRIWPAPRATMPRSSGCGPEMTQTVRHRRCRRGRAVVHRASRSAVPGPLERVTLGPVAAEGLAMGHYKSNVRDLEFNLFEVLELEKALATGEFGDLDGESVRQMLDEASKLAEGPRRRVVRRRRPAPADVRPRDARGDASRVVQEVIAGLAAGGVVPRRARRGHRRCARARDGGVGDQRVPARRPARRRSCTWPARSWRTSSTTSATSNSGTGRRWRSNAIGPPPWCSPNPTPDPMSARAAPRRSSSPTAPGTSTASSGSSPTATPTTCSRTSCTWCSRGPRAPDRAPRA